MGHLAQLPGTGGIRREHPVYRDARICAGGDAQRGHVPADLPGPAPAPGVCLRAAENAEKRRRKKRKNVAEKDCEEPATDGAQAIRRRNHGNCCTELNLASGGGYAKIKLSPAWCVYRSGVVNHSTSRAPRSAPFTSLVVCTRPTCTYSSPASPLSMTTRSPTA